jgi:hypothetical protein
MPIKKLGSPSKSLKVSFSASMLNRITMVRDALIENKWVKSIELQMT